MARRSKPSNATVHLETLRGLLDNFDKELGTGNLRSRVQALIPAYNELRDLGSSLIPIEGTTATAARSRILKYLLEYPLVVIPGAELMVVSGIGEWARRARELREFGWSLITKATAKEMAANDEFFIEGIDPVKMKPDDYILTSTIQDKEAAYRWKLAKDIRKKDISVRDKILEHLRNNVGTQVSGEELRYVAKDATEWARRTRELRTEFGWPVVTKSSGRPDLPVGVYLLEQDRQSPPHDRKIKDDVRKEVLERDSFTCRRCGWNYDQWNRAIPRNLELHHIQAHAKGGENTAENLITLCTVCHDDWHRVNRTGDAVFNEWLKGN